MTDQLALCGAGFIAEAHAAAAGILRIPITAVASRTPGRAAALAAKVGASPVTYDQLPGTAGMVAVCTPPQLHLADSLRLLDRGAAIVLEKPLCTTLADADVLVAAAAQHDERVLYAENLAYAPVVTQLLSRVGGLGPLTYVEARTLQSRPIWRDYASEHWGGGALFDLGVHPLALAVLAAGAGGAGPVVSVSASLGGAADHNTDEHAEVQLNFRSGLVARVVSSWRNEPGQQQWDLQVSSATGVLRVDFWPEVTLEHNGEPVRMPSAAPFIERLGYLDQLREFRADVQLRRRPFMDAAFGRMMLDLVCCAYQSAGHGGRLEAAPFTGDRTATPLQLWRGGRGR